MTSTNVRSDTLVIMPTMTDAYKIPNWRNTCHADKTTAWGAAGARSVGERVAVAAGVMTRRGVVRAAIVAVVLQGGTAAAAQAQEPEPEPPTCRVLCSPEWKVEPTFTIENLANRHRVLTPEGRTSRVNREQVFEMVLALDLATRVPRLGFTAEAIFAPFSDANEAELEFETNLHWLTEAMSRGWVSSHVDIVDQFSPADRPDSRHAYTHKLDFELDTAFHVFKGLPDTRWLHGVELETSLDYLATGLPKQGDVFPDGVQYLDDASHWSFSFVIVLPVAPF